MKNTLRLLALAACLLAPLAARADTLLITATGTVGSLDYNAAFWDGSVTVGTAITVSFQIDTALPIHGSSSGFAEYLDDSGTATATLGDYSMTTTVGTFALAQIYSYYGSQGYSGYSLLGHANLNPVLNNLYIGFQTGTTNLSDVPDTSLSSLYTLPAGDLLYPTITLSGADSSNTYTQLSATATSFTVTVIPTPEPSTWALLALGAGAAGFLSLRRLRLA